MSTIDIPELSLVVLVGVTGSGKSTFAHRNFRATEVLSSAAARAAVADDPNDQSATSDAFAVVGDIARRRLRRGLLTVIDATSLRSEDRQVLLDLAKECDVFAVAVVLDVGLGELTKRARTTGRDEAVVARQHVLFSKSRNKLRKEGFRYVYHLDGAAEIDAVEITRTKLFNNKTDVHGPFDIIGDIHGCANELIELLRQLGWPVAVGDTAGAGPAHSEATAPRPVVVGDHPDGRRLVFVGDLVDRGPYTPDVLAIVMALVKRGVALCVRGNHEGKLLKALRPDRSRRARGSQPTHGLAESLAQLEKCDDAFRAEVVEFLDSLVSHYVLDDGNLVIAHAGLAQRYHGRTSGRVRAAAMYGETTGDVDRWGFPVRIDWARDYRGSAAVVYGHTPVPQAAWVNNTLCLDTGCVFGGRLTALRYPEREIVGVDAQEVHYAAGRPLGYGNSDADVRIRAGLRHDDVLGKRSIRTTYGPAVTVRAENAATAFEVITRYAVDSRWLRYLPPTMSPVGSDDPDLLENPNAAFDYFDSMGITDLVCERKHMGSRAIVVLMRDESTAQRCFGGVSGPGAIYTRTGRSFFSSADTAELLAAAAPAATDLFARLDCEWAILDAEILPWNIKGERLIRDQFAEVAAAARNELSALAEVVDAGVQRGLELGLLASRVSAERADVDSFTDAYAQYVHADAGIDDVRIAPFEILAAGGGAVPDATFETRPRGWHHEVCDRLAVVAPDLFTTTPRISVDTADDGSRARATQ